MSTMTQARRDAIEYRTVRGGLWVAMRFGALSTDFAVGEAEMPAFHDAAKSCGRVWDVVRLLYGLHPMIPPLSSDPNYLRFFTMHEVEAIFKITREQLVGSLRGVTARWLRAKDQQ